MRRAFDDWRAGGPHEDLPSTTQAKCCRCPEEWAWETPEGELLCETHSSQWLRDEKARDEGEEALWEERAEREQEWREAGE